MCIKLAGQPLMERFLQYVMTHPERFARSEVPCCLQALWEEALDCFPSEWESRVVGNQSDSETLPRSFVKPS